MRITKHPELFRSCTDARKLSSTLRAWRNSEMRQADIDHDRLRSKRDTTGISSRADVPDVAGKQTQAAVHSAVASASERQRRPDRCQRSASTIAEATDLSEPEPAEPVGREHSDRKVHDRTLAARESVDPCAVSCRTVPAEKNSPFPSFQSASDPPASHHSSRRLTARWPVAGATRTTPLQQTSVEQS
jgi:hypothetical protein